MKQEMAMFVMEVALKGSKFAYDDVTGFGFFNPYHQFPKSQPKLGYMDRPLFEGHKTYPHLSRPGMAQGSLLALNSAAAPIAIVAASAAGASAITTTYGSLEPGNVNEKQSFWMGLSAALTGGFSMGSFEHLGI